jgi:hypothetical protein
MRVRAAITAFAVVACACDRPTLAEDPGSGAALEAPLSARRWPTAVGYDRDADVSLREALANSHFDGAMITRVQDDVFVLAAREGVILEDSAQRTHEALAALLDGRFSRVPSRPVTVYVLNDRASFEYLCGERLGRACDATWLGVWIKETREILVDQELGRTTLVHELVHPLLEGEAPGLPRWLREGISALYERPEIRGTAIHGVTNWRLADLRRAMASATERELVHLDALFRMPDDLFDGEHALAAYAVARFACQWMDSPKVDKLWRFYRAWRDGAAGDATGEKAFAEVFGQGPQQADPAWQLWVRSL